jgi:hypothetical protein
MCDTLLKPQGHHTVQRLTPNMRVTRGWLDWMNRSSSQYQSHHTCLSSSRGSMAGTPSLSCTLTGSSTSKSTHVTWLGPLVL